MIKRLFLVFCLCMFLTGCSYKNNDLTVIKFSTWGSASELKILTPIIKDFEAQNPKVKVEVLHIPQDYFKKLHLLFASNLAPDVIFINNLNLPVYEKYLEDLEIDETVYFPQTISGMKINGKLKAVPRDVSTLLIFYNKNLFNKYHVPYPKKDWTLEDLITKSKKLTHNGVWGISFEPKASYAVPYINSLNENIIDNNYKNGIQLYKNLAYKYNYAPTPAQIGSKTLAQMFLEGKICMHLSGRWMTPKYREAANFDWDVVNFPDCAATSDTSGWAISKSSKHKDIALKFVMFLSNKENISKFTSDGLIVPARQDVAYSNVFLSGQPKSSKLFLYAVEHSKATKVSKNYNKIIDKLSDSLFDSVK